NGPGKKCNTSICPRAVTPSSSRPFSAGLIRAKSSNGSWLTNLTSVSSSRCTSSSGRPPNAECEGRLFPLHGESTTGLRLVIWQIDTGPILKGDEISGPFGVRPFLALKISPDVLLHKLRGINFDHG